MRETVNEVKVVKPLFGVQLLANIRELVLGRKPLAVVSADGLQS